MYREMAVGYSTDSEVLQSVIEQDRVTYQEAIDKESALVSQLKKENSQLRATPVTPARPTHILGSPRLRS